MIVYSVEGEALSLSAVVQLDGCRQEWSAVAAHALHNVVQGVDITPHLMHKTFPQNIFFKLGFSNNALTHIDLNNKHTPAAHTCTASLTNRIFTTQEVDVLSWTHKRQRMLAYNSK